MRFFTRPLLVLGTALSLLASPLSAATVNITVGDNFYSPATVSAAPGDQIVFTYQGSRSHPTVSDNAAFATFPMDPSHRTHTLSFNAAGTYAFHCQVHGLAMAGQVVVQPTGLRDDAAVAPMLAAFPNPTSASRDGEVTITFNQKPGTEGRIRLLNVIGRVVREQTLRPQGGEIRQAFDIADLPAGVYFTSLMIGDRVVDTRRLVVQP
jgi:plastocyanin